MSRSKFLWILKYLLISVEIIWPFLFSQSNKFHFDLLKIFFSDSTMKIIPTSDAKASSVKRVKYLEQQHSVEDSPCDLLHQPDYGGPVYGHDDYAEHGGPEADPEPCMEQT